VKIYHQEQDYITSIITKREIKMDNIRMRENKNRIIIKKGWVAQKFIILYFIIVAIVLLLYVNSSLDGDEAAAQRYTEARMSKLSMELVRDINKNSVLFGAAIHDIGKCTHTNELSEKGHKHEQEGTNLLISLGVPEEKAKFAAVHATWSKKSTIEELVVSLADKIWKGSRIQDLEDLLIEKIASEIKTEHWEIFSLLDSIIKNIFVYFTLLLQHYHIIDSDSLFIDGTKVQADANRYSFVWRKAVERY